MEKKVNVSVVIITLNEAQWLPDCIASVQFANEVIVVDSGSHDNTVQVARELGAIVHQQPFSGFARQKQFAVDRCKNQWVLILDADERIPAETADAICRAVASASEEIAAFSFQRKNFLHQRWIRYCGWWPDRVARLVRRGWCGAT